MKNIIKLTVFYCLYFAWQTSPYAQDRTKVIGRCATTTDRGPKDLPRAPKDMAPWIKRYLNPPESNSIRTIPVAFHVIYKTDGVGNISDAEINSQLNVLNVAFSWSRYEFSLDRITRTQNNTWYNNMNLGSANETNMKNTLAVSPATILNFYITRPRNQNGAEVLGFASFPWDHSESSNMHGVVIQNASLPQGMFEDAQYDDGDTGVHEIGHFMGLYHTFQGNSCSGTGDLVDDTPIHNAANYVCSTSNTCPSYGNDPIDNYMNYTPDPCMIQFTIGQRARVDWAMATYKPSMSALYVTLTGDTYLPSGITGYWGAGVAGGSGNCTFNWYYRPLSGSFTLVRSITTSNVSDTYSRTAENEDFEIKVEVTRGNDFDGDDILVDVCTGGDCPFGPIRSRKETNSTEELNLSQSVPETFMLDRNYPNPFNPQTEIRFTLPVAVHVSIVVYDAVGREITRLVDSPMEAGHHYVKFKASNLPSGFYLYRITAGGYTEVKRMMLAK